MARGQFRIYLGAAPGVGKTFAMLEEARRRKSRGTDVVIGLVETHGRASTIDQLGDLEVVPRRQIAYRGTTFEELDTDAVIARAPEVVLVDELAHTNAPGSRNPKRWQDVEELLEAGIEVISTVNIQHLESLNDVIQRITGIEQREIVPDAIVRSADQVQLVDQTPEALRRRMAHGNIYSTERVDAALGNYFRVGNLTALRELALMWVADQVDDALQRYRASHGIEAQWETRERVVVALTGAPGGDDLIRRAARVAVRARGDLLGVHVRNVDGLVEPEGGHLDEHRALLQALGGTYHEVSGADIAPALVRFAESQNATQIVLGASRRSRWREIISGSVINQVNRLTDNVDVHIIPTARESTALPRMPKRSTSLDVVSTRRRQVGWVLALVAPIAVTAVLLPLRGHIGLTSDLFAFLLGVLMVSTIGGLGPAIAAAVVAFGLGNWFFTPPYHTFSIDRKENLFSLFAFLVVAGAVGLLVGSASRRAAEAARARSEAETLAALAAAISRSDDRLEVIVEQLRDAFGTRAAALLRRVGTGWQTEAAVGDDPPIRPDQGFRAVPIDNDTMAVLAGEPANGIDDEVLAAFCAQLGDALDRRRLQQEARRATELAELNELRSALLNAVSHDLRTPLAAIKAAASSLRQHDITWSPADEAEFLATIEGQTDRLTALITNLLGMSQIEAGAVDLSTRPVGMEEVISRVLSEINPRGHRVEVDVPETLPEVAVDPTLLERVVANLIDNACKWSPEGAPVRLSAAAADGFVTLQVVDQGPGIPRSERDAVFEPFQRRGDTAAVEGTGLGLAVARGFTRVMGGTLEIDDSPGGGATMRLGLPIATPSS